MIQRICKRFVSLLLVAVMVLLCVPNITLPAYAATSDTVTGLSDTNIGLSYSGDADNAWSASGTTIIGSATSVAGTCSDTSYNSTLTITNKKATTATLSFDYSVALNSGTIQVAGTAVKAGGKYSGEVAAGESIKVYIESGSTTATQITISNIALVSDVTATTTFEPAENGSYTVNGNAITESYSNTQSSTEAYQVVATAASGYQFLGWYNVTTGKYINTNATASLNIEGDSTITAKFALKTAAIFETGGQPFTDLDEAAAYAQNNAQTLIKLASDGIITGNYTIPAGITLLIPFDAAGTLYTTTPGVIRTTPASKAYRTLTMASGSSIVAYGDISLGGQYFAAAGNEQGRCVGNYGCIRMQDDSSITLKNGSSMYAWGFVTGNGSVLAESGATVYEFYQIADFRGGSASSAMENKVFPFSQYFIQNVEVTLTLCAGAKESVCSGVYAMNSTYTTTIQFIGDSGMFKIVSGSFTKDYDEATDRLIFTVDGKAELNTLSLKLAGMSVNSENYVLPITNNFLINIVSGKITINQDAALLPGVQVNVAEGADLTVADGKNLYVYDSDEWTANNYVLGGKFKSVAYAPGKTYTRTIEDLKDVQIDVNGSITAIGAVYTTAGGANICSNNKTGKYIQLGKPGSETETYQYTQDPSVTSHAIPITAAKLKNADDSYTETASAAAGDIYVYSEGKWKQDETTPKYTVTWKNSDDTVLAVTTVNEGVIPTYPEEFGTPVSTWEDEDYTEEFSGWSPELSAATNDVTYTAQYEKVLKYMKLTLHANYEGSDESTVIKVWPTAEGHDGMYTADNGTTYVLLPMDAFTRPGYSLYEWTNDPDANKATVHLNPDKYGEEGRRFYYTGSYETDLYAQWNPVVHADGWCSEGDSFYYYKDGQPVTGTVRMPYPSAELLSGYGTDAEDAEVNVPGKEGNPDNYDYPDRESALFVFDENGVFQKEQCGVYDDNGITRWINNGMVIWHAGLVRDGADYRYFKRSGMVTNIETYVAKTNGLLKAAKYTFDSEGKLMQLQGLHEDLNGNLCYYVDYVKNYAGLVEVDGNYYYIASDLKAVKNCTYYVTKNNNLKPAGFYTFDAEGKMVIKNGLVEENGDLYFYADGAKTAAGLIKVDGNYYYIASDLKAVKNAKHYVFADRANGLKSAGWYWFNADGTMFLEGIREEAGMKYYYKDGVKDYAGLIEISGEYYYVKSDCSVVCGRSYYVTKNNGLAPSATYTFGADGRMEVKNGIYREKLGDGNEYLFYYVNNVCQINTGLVQLDDGSYIYVRSGANLAVGSYYVSKTNDLLPKGTYTFGEDGKMIMNHPDNA